MELINGHLNIVLEFFAKNTVKTLTVGMTDVGNWLVADDDIEIATMIVVRYMIKHNYNCITHWNLCLHRHDNNKSYTLYLKP
jgi:hypothetical protein